MHKHLDETVMEEYRNRMVPAIPLPQVHIRKIGLFRKREEAHCACGIRFLSMDTYMHHYRTEQLIEMNENLGKARELSKEKAMFWRRVAFIYKHGTKEEIERVDQMVQVQFSTLTDMKSKNSYVENIYGPVYLRVAKDNDLTVGHIKDETTIEDETPEEARQ